MYFKRKLESTIIKYLKSPEILAVVGPRQCGKTTMLKHVYSQLGNAIFLTFEDKELLDLFEGDIKEFISHYKSYDFVFIDEFQYAKNGGKLLKFWFDTSPTKIIISGSSVIDLSVKAVKYLVGRVFILNLYPFDFEEFLDAHNYNDKNNHELMEKLYEQYCIYGGYPRVITTEEKTEKEQILKDIYNTFFLREVRDILGLVDDFKLSKLLKLLAGQIGNLIQYRELASGSEFSEYEVKKHLNFFTKTFTCYFPKPFFTNPRTQIVKNPKVYFVDTGLRNYILNDFRPLLDRPDGGALLENGVAMQFIKKKINFSFWRTKKQAEVDFVVDIAGGKRVAWEIKTTLRDRLNNSSKEFRRLYPSIPLRVGYYKKSEKVDNEDAGSIYLL